MARSIWVLVLTSLAPAGALGQSFIAGTLREQRGDKLLPVAGCMVYAQSIDNGPLVAEFSKDQGRFALDFEPDARVTVGADCPGYRLFSVAGRRGPPPTFDCSRPGPCASDVEVTVEPLAIIEGYTVDPNGSPLEGVQLLGRQLAAGRPTGPIRARSDDRGYFRFFHLQPGSYEIAPTLHDGLGPNLHWEADKLEIEVGPGDVRSGLQVQFRLNQGVEFTGRIDGLPPGTQRVMLHLTKPDALLARTQAQQVEVDEQGRFKLSGVPRGRYEVELMVFNADGSFDQKSRAHIGVADVGGEGEALLARRDPIRVHGALQVEAPEREDLRGSMASSPLQMRFQREDGFTQHASANPPDYRFEVEGLRPGRYRMFVSGPGPRVERRLGEDRWEPFREIELRTGETVELELRVRFEMGRLRVLVRPAEGSGEKEAAHYVVGFRRNGATQLYPADQHGRLLLNYFAGGEYEICAWADMSPEEAADPETWRKAGDAVRTFRHEEGADMEIALTAAP